MLAFNPASAALLGHTTMPVKTAETGNNESSIIEDKLAELVLSLLEGLKQGPPVHLSVHPQSRTAGVRLWRETNNSVLFKMRRRMHNEIF